MPRIKPTAAPLSPSQDSATGADDAPRPPRSSRTVPPPPPRGTATAAREPEPLQELEAQLEEYQSELLDGPQPERAARLHFEIAQLSEWPLADGTRAAEHYVKAVALAPDHLPSIRGARRVLLRQQQYSRALELFDSEIRVTPDPKDKASLLYARGQVLEDALQKPAQAKQDYRAALELDPGNLAILKAIERIELAEGASKALLRTYEEMANALADDPTQRAAVIMRQADLAAGPLGRVELAIELYQNALRVDPRARRARLSLARLHYEHKRYRDLIEVLEAEVEHYGDPETKATLLYRIARLYAQELKSRAEAISALKKAAEQTPRNLLVLHELARLYEAERRWEELARVLQVIVENTEDARSRRDLLYRIGSLSETKLADPMVAVSWYEAALELGPTHAPTIQALHKLYLQQEDYHALIGLRLGEASTTQHNERKVACLCEAAELAESKLGHTDQAIEHYREALALQPDYGQALRSLERLYTAAGRYGELIELHQQALDNRPDVQGKVMHLLKIGMLYDDALDDPVQAAHTYRTLLQLDPHNSIAIHALQRASERAGNHRELVAALEMEIRHTKDAATRVRAQLRCAQILDQQLDDSTAALRRYLEVLQSDRTNLRALGGVADIYYRTGRWEELLDIYARQLPSIKEPQEKAALLLEMADVARHRVGREERALAYCRQAVEADPTYGPALQALAEALTERRNWKELTELLIKQLGTIEEPAAQAVAAFRIGESYEEHVHDFGQALHYYEKALAFRPDFKPALEAVDRLRAVTRSFETLAGELEARAERSDDTALQLDAWLRAGELWSEHAGDPAAAIRCFENARAIDATNVDALWALETLYKQAGDEHDKLAQIYSELGDVAQLPEAKIANLREQLRLVELHEPGDTARKRKTLHALLQLSDDDLAALQSLEDLAFADQDWSALSTVDERLADSSTDASLRAFYRTRLAQSLEAAGNMDALRHYSLAAEDDPDSLGAAHGLSRTARRHNNPTALTNALRREADLTQDNGRAALLLARSAEQRLERLADTEGAIADLEDGLGRDPDNVKIVERLGAVLAGPEHANRLVGILRRAAEAASSPERKAELWLRISRVQSETAENVGAAVSALNRGLELVPGSVPLLTELGRLCVRRGQWKEAAEVLRRAIDESPRDTALIDAYVQLAEIHDQRLGQRDKALKWLIEAERLDADRWDVLDRLADLYVRAGKPAEAVRCAEALMQRAGDDAQRVRALVRLGNAHARAGDSDEAERHLADAVSHEGASGLAAPAYRALLQSHGRWERYAESLQRFLETQGAPAPQDFIELARTHADRLGQADEGLTVLREGIDALQPDNGELRFELARRLRNAGHAPLAVEQLRDQLYADPADARGWRELLATYQADDKAPGVWLAAQALVAIDAATPAEQALAEQAPHSGPSTLDGEALARVGPALKDAGPAVSLLAAIRPALPRLYPADREALGAPKPGRLATQPQTPLHAVAREIARSLGVELYELHLHRSRNVTIEFDDKPLVFVPAFAETVSTPQQRFLVAKPMVALACGLEVMLKLTPRELQVLLAAAARTVDRKFGSGLTSEDVLDDQHRLLHRALSRRQRKTLEAAARSYVDDTRVDPERWYRSGHYRFGRAALLLANDLPEVIRLHKDTDSELRSLSGAEAIRRWDALADLMRFWISETAHQLR